MNDNIRRKVGIILGQAIPENGWEMTFSELDKQGRMDNSKVWKVLIVVLKEMEKYEKERAKNIPQNTVI